jgi:hypothetical protein
MDMDILIAFTQMFKEYGEDEIRLLSERLIATFPSVGKSHLHPIK